MEQPRAICDYEGTSYRARFWDGQGREYEDLAERIALKKLLPPRGRRIMEIGAGFGRLADLYEGYDQVVLLDYAKSGLREAQEQLGRSGKFIYVAADLYHLPLAPGACDTIVTVRVLHHVMDVPAAFRSIHATLRPGGAYVLEYANKRHFKSVARYLLRRQRWSPFSPQPYEFVELNFDFHPRWIHGQLGQSGFKVERGLAVSHFRFPLLKRLVPPHVLAAADGLFQGIGAVWKLTPSIFLRARATHQATEPALTSNALFHCPRCHNGALDERPDALTCEGCGAIWPIDDGIYDFKAPANAGDINPQPSAS